MKTIQLTQGQAALVDDEDYNRINAHKWCAQWHRNARSFYATRGSRDGYGKRRAIHMHREVMGTETCECVDHINHNTLDNRRDNLRVCSNSQNQANQRLSTKNTSGFKGVYWYKERGKWRVNLKVNNKRCHCGYFVTALEAAIAYDKAAREAFGEFALTNEKLGLITLQGAAVKLDFEVK